MTLRKRIANQSSIIGSNTVPMLLDERDAAKYLGVSVSYLRKGRCQGTLRHETPPPPHVKIGGRVYYRISDLDKWIENLKPKETI